MTLSVFIISVVLGFILWESQKKAIERARKEREKWDRKIEEIQRRAKWAALDPYYRRKRKEADHEQSRTDKPK